RIIRFLQETFHGRSPLSKSRRHEFELRGGNPRSEESAGNLLRSGLRCVGSNFFRVTLNFPDGGGDLMHVLLVAEQSELRNPHGFPSRSLRVREPLAEEGMVLGRLCASQALAIFAGTKAVKFVQGRITRLGGNTFGVQCRNKILSGNSRE